MSNSRTNANIALATAASNSVALKNFREVNRNGQASVKTVQRTLYVIGEIVGAGKINLFEEIQKRKVGVTNFDKDTLKTMRNFVGTHAGIFYATTTEATATGADLAYTETAPASIQNGEFDLEMDGKKVIDSPVFMLHNSKPNQSNNVMDSFTYLEDYPVLESQKIYAANFDLGATAKLDKTNGKRHFVKIAIHGFETLER